ncbi:hypothetical protein Athai_09770 [Actinocatenispora thailandica]|uniref:Uncharacterized protein n=1 Tax=Actinocatenispora thailandica TaxID=227318 RepID=A0A7R7DKN7_9ACTN|nr:hypothetical protein [Actinocatenispora thailandica]BCJ33474.1 hypothetical protein Athai_09770 [Actinocatenispora thailandica]
MVVIPGDLARIGGRTVRVVEAYWHSDRQVEILAADGLTWWAPAAAIRLLPADSPAPPTPVR